MSQMPSRIMHTAVSLDRAHKLATLISATFPSLSGTSAVADALRELSVDELTPSNSSMSAGSSFSSASPDVVGHAGTHTLASTIERLRHAALEPGTSVGKVSANVPAAAAAPAPSAPTNAAVVTPPTMLGPEVMFVLAPVFIAACKRGAVKCVHVLLSFGVNVNTQSDADDQSGLFAATAGGHRACMSLLLSRGANPNLVDHESRMALHAAVLRGDKEAVALLLAAGADVAARDHDGHSMLFFAVSTGNADIVQQLIDAGAPTNTSAVPASPLSGRLYDQPPLLLSCRFGFFDVANRLICAGADPNATDEAGETALHAACSENAVECVELLLKHQAQVDVRDVYSSRTPLFDAAIGGHLSCVEKLLAAGAKALVRDVDGWRPLVHAMLRGHMFVVAVLREHERAEQKANPTELRAPKPANPSFVAPRRAGQLHPHIQASDKAPAPSAVPKPPSPSIVDGEVTEKISNAERSYGHTYLRRRTRIDIFLGGVDDQGPIIDLLHYGHTMRDSNGAFTSRRTLYDPILTSTFQERPPGEIATSQTAVLVKSESSTDFSHDTALGPIERSASFSTLGAPQASPMFDKQNVPLSLSSFRLQIASNQPQTDLVMIDLPIVEPSAAHHMYYCEDIATMQLRIDVISQADDTLIGRGFILASTLARLRGETRCALFSPSMQLIGTVLITFLIVKPLHHPRVAVGSNTYWKLTESLPIIGHRGVGAGGAAKTGDFHRTHIKENTVLSFVTAASLGAQYVEFDVQMTKDGVPVIYHDWTVKETGYNLPVCRLSLEKFTSIYHAQGGRSKDRRLVRSKSFDAADIVSARPLQAGSGVTHDVAHDIMNSPKSSARPVRHKRDNDYQAMLESAIKLQIGDEGVAAPFPTLEDALKNVPITLGFNVEVKYPLREEREEFDLQMMELNNFIDRILTCVYDNAGERPIIFSSFHPETCLMLSLKQPNYPVFFLTSAGWDNERFSDPRCNSIYWAIHFAKAANLLGKLDFVMYGGGGIKMRTNGGLTLWLSIWRLPLCPQALSRSLRHSWSVPSWCTL
ncbi:glycerophosphodiesterase GDE1, variant [Capsaspora owczarzaki ATCC 30864]|uniref:Glycerophosphodiesterase GDE1, variant n=1 Tax=Capsaspora owczarzaki (strain ATCC 30864) TaxID=595528 RepID=A0A0D2WUZ1_CAPO3|nr:glycerophosphodiesterase GDE1, variant [Capsaspora owczarzaki ATCC 30864]